MQQPLALNADQGPEAGDTPREASALGSSYDRADVLVSAERLFSHPGRRRRADQNSCGREIVDDVATAPLLERPEAGERAAVTVTGRGESFSFAHFVADQNVRACPHAAAVQNRLANRT